MSQRVVVTGLGTVSPYGVGVRRLWDGIRQNKSGLKYDQTLGVVVGSVPRGEDEGNFNVNEFTVRDQREMSIPTLLTLKGVEEALQNADLHQVDREFHRDTAVNIGMGIADLEEIHKTGTLIENGKSRQVGPFFVPKILTNIPGGYVALKYGFKGGNSSSTTACATGLTCIAESFAQIQAGRVRRAVAGSVESCLNQISVVGFQRMRALASKTDTLDDTHYSVSRPFDTNRNGFLLSEGAGIVVLERLDDAKARGAKIYAEILGYGISNDAYHLTSPHPDGLASEWSIRRCLTDSGLSPDDVQYVNAHATSTKVGDKAEAISIARLFGSNVALSSLKGHLGHCVSAAGSIETIASITALCNGKIPPTLNLQSTDIEEDIDLVQGDWRDWPKCSRRVVVKNSFGFGGAFVSLAFAQI
ncbi:unnamed protein product [Bursaphelenchus xylophilus]|uniref:beta-ketoacyl-[acyl-carrier-protein] synthase I n=1 Tax=Bursaphelenchus xylophilus TaxID=6326 RepID=A0A1I7RYC3_BURXY|nr:unnamed protein product [Bursaphelenchus xylophilus]CAG9085581.1 unnamed protein product [Bursaphelenchus xylophilus]